LERQSGGIGMRGGPGETQIELDRRMIGENIKRTKERLMKVKRQRQTQRRQRERRDAFNISLIGYTNAGKSTLFNALVKARAYAADQLFATLDTTTRQLYLGEAGRSVSLSDTVGFIRDLPHGLVDAFQATLQEAIDADLLLHVVDASNPNFVEQIEQVQRVLKEIGAENIPQLLVFNKIDALDAEHQPVRAEDDFEIEGVQTPRIFVSAKDLSGIPILRQRLASIAAAANSSSDAPIYLPEDQGAGE
jgi:GTP-binding protein HflX